MDIKDIRSLLVNAPRLGADADAPEGSRYIVLSETLLERIIAGLQPHLENKKTIMIPVSVVEDTDYHVDWVDAETLRLSRVE